MTAGPRRHRGRRRGLDFPRLSGEEQPGHDFFGQVGPAAARTSIATSRSAIDRSDTATTAAARQIAASQSHCGLRSSGVDVIIM